MNALNCPELLLLLTLQLGKSTSLSALESYYNEKEMETKRMKGLFMKMLNRNKFSKEDINNKLFKLELCKEEYLMTNIDTNNFNNIIKWIYTIMRIKSDYPGQRIVLSKALDDNSINAI
jgi:hypothetical protein